MSTRSATCITALTGAVLTVVVALTLATVPLVARQQAASEPRQFGADYEGLSDAQRALVDEIYVRLGKILGKTLDPKKSYNQTALSVRTTFDAVTHALLTSTLTDKDTGEALGTAIELVDYLETVAGQATGARGDEQFRLYVALKAGAVDRLARSREFHRTADNMIFHKGYPTSYRQEGYPSVQFSITRDGTRADIDVDYRSSRFPAALVNGHLTASNSDVRAGNYERHNSRWSGLVNWWEGFMSALFSARVDIPEEDERFPVRPRAGTKTIDVAVDDFLTSWLVEGRPNLAVAYTDAEAYECMAIRLAQEAVELDRGLAPVQLWARMKLVNDAIGPRASLEGTTTGIRLVNPNLKMVAHRRRQLYAIYAVPREIAEQMKCGSYSTLGAIPEAEISRFRKDTLDSFYSAFVIAGPLNRTLALGLLWQRRDGNWKIVSYQAAQDEAAAHMADIRPETAPVQIARMPGDPGFIMANERFLDAWLVGKRYDEAFEYVSPRCYPCMNLYLDPSEPVPSTPAAQAARLRLGVERLGERVGRVARLEDVIHGVELADPRLRLVEHPRQAAFGLFALPDWAGPAAECEARLARGDAPAPEGVEQTYGRYYVSALQFKVRAGETAVLYLGWTKEDDAWRVFSFKIVEP